MDRIVILRRIHCDDTYEGSRSLVTSVVSAGQKIDVWEVLESPSVLVCDDEFTLERYHFPRHSLVLMLGAVERSDGRRFRRPVHQSFGDARTLTV